MTIFKDSLGREWTLDLNVTSLRRIKAMVGIDLGSIFTTDLYQRIQTDVMTLADVLWGFCKPQAEKLPVTQEQFDGGLKADTIIAARKAVMEEIINFTPDPEDRANLKAVLEAGEKAAAANRKVIAEKVASGAIEAMVQMQTPSTDSSGDAPDS